MRIGIEHDIGRPELFDELFDLGNSLCCDVFGVVLVDCFNGAEDHKRLGKAVFGDDVGLGDRGFFLSRIFY